MSYNKTAALGFARTKIDRTYRSCRVTEGSDVLREGSSMFNSDRPAQRQHL